MADIEDEARELESRGENIATFVGTKRQRIELLERTMADSVRLTRMLTDGLIKLTEQYHELENKLEHARLYGFSRTADDD
jgi:predicted nuclease with TOPRIM domain